MLLGAKNILKETNFINSLTTFSNYMPYSLSLSLCVWGEKNREKHVHAIIYPPTPHHPLYRPRGVCLSPQWMRKCIAVGRERERETLNENMVLLPHSVLCVCFFLFFGENKNKNINMAYYEHKWEPLKPPPPKMTVACCCVLCYCVLLCLLFLFTTSYAYTTAKERGTWEFVVAGCKASSLLALVLSVCVCLLSFGTVHAKRGLAIVHCSLKQRTCLLVWTNERAREWVNEANLLCTLFCCVVLCIVFIVVYICCI